MKFLEFVNVCYKKENKDILRNISLKVEQEDFISIVGPSGSGKSTLLKLCSNLISPDKGSIIYRDQDMFLYNPMELRRRVCYCFQMPYLFGNNPMDNLMFPYLIRNMKMDNQQVLELIKSFNLSEDILEKDNKNLSGGEKQRIALIRTILFKPDIILLDEVTSALDVDNTYIVENEVNRLNKQGVTVLWVTHSADQSRKYANKLLTMEKGEVKSIEVIR